MVFRGGGESEIPSDGGADALTPSSYLAFPIFWFLGFFAASKLGLDVRWNGRFGPRAFPLIFFSLLTHPTEYNEDYEWFMNI